MHLQGADDRLGRADALYRLGELCQIRGDLAGRRNAIKRASLSRGRLGTRGAWQHRSRQASVYQLTGAATRVESCLEKARHHLQDIGDEMGAARMHSQLADFFFLEGRHKEAVGHYEKSLSTLEECDDLLAARAQSRIGQCFLDLGEDARAEYHLKRAREIMQGQGDLCSEADLLITLAGSYRRQDRLEEALQCTQQCLKVREQQNDPHAIAAAYSCMGLIYADRREYNQGKVCFQKAADLFTQTGICIFAAEAFSNLGSMCHLQGELEDALIYYRRALEIFSDIGQSSGPLPNRGKFGPDLPEQRRTISCRRLFTKEPGNQR